MKGLILSGGTGSRIKPFSLYTAKQLLPVLNKPVLFHNLDILLRAGIKDIGIVVGPMKKFVYEAIENSSYSKLAKINFIEQPNPKGLAHAVAVSRDFLENDNFIMILGDNYFTIDPKDLIFKYYEKNYEALVALTKVDEPSRYGIAEIKNKEVIKVVEKPKNPRSNWALAGLYIFNAKIHKIIENLEPSFRDEYEITDAIQKLIIQNKKIAPYYLKGYWRDIGTLKDLLETNIDLIKNYSLKKSEPNIIPPVMIDKSAVITNSTIGPNVVIGANSVINNSTISNSLVLPNSNINNSQEKNMIFSPWCEEKVK